MKELKETSDEISQASYERLYNLYQSKKSQVTLDGKRAGISRLKYKFPIVFVAGSYEVEFSSKAVERILSAHCKFSS